MKRILPITIVVVVIGTVGCTPLSLQTKVSPSSPANPEAPESPIPPPPPVLMTGTNYAMGPEGSGQPMNMSDHGSHSMKVPAHETHEKPAEGQKHEHHEDNAPKQ